MSYVDMFSRQTKGIVICNGIIKAALETNHVMLTNVI